jgi:hypothetical protein
LGLAGVTGYDRLMDLRALQNTRSERFADLIALAWQAVMPPDPGRVRLYNAVRTTVTGIFAWLVILAMREAVPIPSSAMFLGVSGALSATAFVRDISLSGQCITLLGAAFAGFMGVVIGMAVEPSHLLAPAVMVVLIFLAVYAPEFGARPPVLGLACLSGFIFALLTHPAIGDLPRWLLALCLGAACACLVRGLLPDRATTVLARMESSIRASIARVLARIDLVLQQGAWRTADRRAVHREIDLLNAATLMAESAAAAPALALHFFALELVTERFARAAQLQLPPPAERAALSARIAGVKMVLAGGVAAVEGDSPMAAYLANLATLLATPAADSPAVDSVAGGPAATVPHRLSSPVLHHALQAGLASGLAIVGGDLLSPRRWYWAAMTAYVLFQGIRSRADSLVKAWQALAGTLGGALVGLVLASLLAGHEAALIAAIFVGVFFAYQASQAAFAMMNFWLTICLGLLFGLLGAFSIDVLLIRFLEAVIGAAAGMLTAWLFLGTSSAAVARTSAKDVLAALLAVVQAASRAALAATPEPALAGLGVTLHGRIGDLLAIARPRLYGLGALGDRGLRRQVVALTFCANWGRELAFSALQATDIPTEEVADIISGSAARIEADVRLLQTLLEQPAGRGDQAVKEEAPAPVGLPSSDEQGTAAHIARLLLRIDSALLQMIRRAQGER